MIIKLPKVPVKGIGNPTTLLAPGMAVYPLLQVG
jgi:hypothetical protein